MPYFTRKRLQRYQTGFQNSYVLYIDLKDEETWERYNYYFVNAEMYLVRGKVGFISDKEDKTLEIVGKTYDFRFRSQQHHDGKTWVYDSRSLYLPESLTNGFGLRAGMGIEITLNEFIIDPAKANTLANAFSESSQKILGEVEWNGDKDFELKGIKGELLNTSEVLVSTKFTNEFYNNLVTEINTAYKIGLWTSTEVLLRKLFENLLIDLLRERYKNDQTRTKLYYSNGQYQSFQNLKDTFKDTSVLNDIGQFEQTIVKDKGFIPFLETIRMHGDKNAHTMEIIHNPERIRELKDDINNYSSLLVRIIHKISNRTDVC